MLFQRYKNIPSYVLAKLTAQTHTFYYTASKTANVLYVIIFYHSQSVAKVMLCILLYVLRTWISRAVLHHRASSLTKETISLFDLSRKR